MIRWRCSLVVAGVVSWLSNFVVAAVTGPAGGGAPHENVQPSLGLNYIISLQGIYPSQNGSGGGDEGGGSGIEPFLGEVSLFAGNFAPRGWALAQGQWLPINQNQALFSLLGTTFGGNGITTFALPDLRSRVPIGMGQGSGLTNRQLGQQLGIESVTLNESQLPSHSHTLPSGGTTAATGSGMVHENMQPSLGINYLIARQGIFPQRSGGGTGSTGGIDPYLGEVIMFAGNFAPHGWSFADGAALQISQNQALFSLLGTNYGGNGTSTFALPDLRGRMVVGTGQGTGLSNRDIGDSFGVESVALTTARLPAHSHSLPPSGSTGSTGNGASHTNLQPSLALNYIIALEGIYPSRNGSGSGDEGGGSGGSPYLGEIALFAGNFAPQGWAFAQGQLLSISQNDALYSLLGTTYGGDGQTTFALPDLRGRAAMGAGQGTDLTSRILGGKVGAESGALTIAQMPAHSHSFIVPPPGDYNQNGMVDAADYTVWRNSRGSTTNLAADGNNNGTVNNADYTYWRVRFGQTVGSGAASNATVIAEPMTQTMVAMALLAMCCYAGGWSCHNAGCPRSPHDGHSF